jgi:hypothetical protein
MEITKATVRPNFLELDTSYGLIAVWGRYAFLHARMCIDRGMDGNKPQAMKAVKLPIMKDGPNRELSQEGTTDPVVVCLARRHSTVADRASINHITNICQRVAPAYDAFFDDSFVLMILLPS